MKSAAVVIGAGGAQATTVTLSLGAITPTGKTIIPTGHTLGANDCQ